MDSWDGKSFEHVREEVKECFRPDARVEGKNAKIEAIRELFAAKPSGAAGVRMGFMNAEDEDGMVDRDNENEDGSVPSSSLLRKYLIALTSHVSSLHKEYSRLAYAVLDYKWWDCDDRFVNAYIRFLGSLVSAHGGYTSAVLKMLVGRFGDDLNSVKQTQNSPIKQKYQPEDRAHQAIRYILELSPLASRPLASLLSSLFPFETDKNRVHVSYVQNLLRLLNYAPELKGDVLTLICEKLVKTDVQIQVEMDELEEEEEEVLLQQIATADTNAAEEDSDASDDEPMESDDSDDEDEGEHIQLLKKSLTKLDSLMDILFYYYTTEFSKGTQSQADDVLEQLISSFTSIVLPTHRSRHVQFLLFHFSQMSADFVEKFLATLAQVTFAKARPSLIREAGAAYLASFVARGAHLSTDVVRDVVALLGNQLDGLREVHEKTSRGPDLRKYGIYYATVQAILYIFCFRWQDLIIHPDDEEIDEDEVFYGEMEFDWASNIKAVLNRNIYSRLNPLKICSPAIVTQFASVARHLRFMYVFPLLESNKRIRLAHVFGASADYGLRTDGEVEFGGKVSDSIFQMDAYFPFDPYQLPKSKRWLDGDYNEWKSMLPGDGTAMVGTGAQVDEQKNRDEGSISSDLIDEDGNDDEVMNDLVDSDSESV